MNEKNINVDFDVSRNFSISMITGLNENTRNQLYQILGVYLDNAIQAAEKTDKGLIKINIYNTEEFNGKYLVISIMNNYTGIIESDKINQKGYSTKGKGRGLGLSIVSEVLEQNPEIKNKTKIIKNNFMQELKVKL